MQAQIVKSRPQTISWFKVVCETSLQAICIHFIIKLIKLIVLLDTGTVVGGLANLVNGRTGHQNFSTPSIVAVPESALLS